MLSIAFLGNVGFFILFYLSFAFLGHFAFFFFTWGVGWQWFDFFFFVKLDVIFFFSWHDYYFLINLGDFFFPLFVKFLFWLDIIF